MTERFIDLSCQRNVAADCVIGCVRGLLHIWDELLKQTSPTIFADVEFALECVRKELERYDAAARALADYADLRVTPTNAEGKCQNLTANGK
jgi:hypothetical protein